MRRFKPRSRAASQITQGCSANPSLPPTRLAQQWASATFQQAEAKMKADLEQMQLYLTASQENANRQAPMWLALGAWLSVFCLILFCGCVRALWT